jgi:5,10-methylenetetrahydromethanopterin reductase
MKEIEIGIGFRGSSQADVLAYADVASGYKFDSLAPYGDLGDMPPYRVLRLMTKVLQNSKIPRIGPMGVPIGRMRPEAIANSAVQLEQNLPGRTFVGLVRGAFLESIGKHPASLARMEETIKQVRATSRRHGHEIPVYVGGYGPKILKLAGSLSVEGVKLGGSTNPNLAEFAREAVNNDAVKIVMGAVSVIDNDRRSARTRARFEVAKYLEVVGGFDSTLNEDEQASLQQFMLRQATGDPVAYASISGSLLDKFAVAGTPDDAISMLNDLQGTVDRFEFGTPHGIDGGPAGVRFIAENILEGFKL